MGTEDIVARILSDAEEEAKALIAAAEQSAAETASAARLRREARKAETEKEVSARADRIREGKAAAARLDSQKILLAEKRRVVDNIYARALIRLLELPQRESLALLSRLLEENAEEGDEVVFASDYPHCAEAAELPVIRAKKLTVSKEKGEAGGGCILRGERCDKDLRFSALLALDREEHQAELAAKLFAVRRAAP